MFTQAVDDRKRDFTDSVEWQVEEARAAWLTGAIYCGVGRRGHAGS